MNTNVILEKEAYELAKSSSKPPFIFQLPVNEGRKILETAQSSHICMCNCNTLKNCIDTKKYGHVNTYIIIPSYFRPIRNIIFYIHGAGWTFGSYHTHEKLVKELSYRTNSVVIFPEYSLSPEAKFPTSINQCYFILNNIPNILISNNIVANLDTLTVAGDSVGGNMATVMTIMSKFENGIKISKQLLFYPVTDDNFNTNSYLEFSNGYYLYRDSMIWFWNQYAPDLSKRNPILATPLKASLKQLSNLPNTLIINGEADVLRDEGLAYANKLRKAGNNVTSIQIQGIIHDFVMLNSLDNTNACRVAMNISTSWINCENL